MSSGTQFVPRQGGVFAGSLDRKRRFSAHLDVFEPPRRMRLVHMPPEDVPLFDGVIVDDIFVEPRERDTLVRVLGSGFPRQPELGEFYMRRQLGWRAALARLKVFLEKGLDIQPPAPVPVIRPAPQDVPAVASSSATEDFFPLFKD